MDSTTSRSLDPDRIARLERLLDRQEILDCLVRFSRGMDRFDRELFLSAFHSDAIIDAGEFVGGPEALYDWASALHERGQVSTHHDLLNHTPATPPIPRRTTSSSGETATRRTGSPAGATSTGWSSALESGGSPCAATPWSGRVRSPARPSRSRAFRTSTATASRRGAGTISPIDVR